VSREFPAITTLIPDLKAGDEDSWTSLVELFTPGLSGKAYVLLRNSQLRGQLDPDDLVSETFAKSWKHHRHLRGESTYQVAKWLLTIMVNTFRDACRKCGLQEEPQAFSFDPISPSGTPVSDAESLEEEIKLHAKLAELHVDDREVIVLRYWQDLTHNEIGQRLGKSRLSVTRQLQKAMLQLQKIMK
jgi:RNA polymerase sigma-70 factor (ECF subfamily)